MRFLRKVFLPAVALAASLHHAASATTIDFNTLTGTYESAFTSYTENGFTIATRSGNFYVDPAGVNPSFGNPAPDIFAADNLSPTQAESLTVTKVGGGAFTLTSFDLEASNANPNYAIIGSIGTSQVYDVTGSGFMLPATPANLQTYNPGVNALAVTSVVVSFSDVGLDSLNLAGIDLDNFVLNGATAVSPVVTPEPGSLVFVGTGIMSLCGIMRRRLRR